MTRTSLFVAVLLSMLIVVLVSPCGAQQPQPSPSASLKGFALEEGTPIKLKLNRNISSADAQVGENVDFEVIEEVDVNGITVISKGAMALATVTEAQPKRRMGRGGKLDMNIDSVRLADGEKATLRAVKEGKGGGHTGAMTAGIVATGLLVWPAAPFFLFMHGKDVTIPKGAELIAYVDGDMKLDVARFQPGTAGQQTASAGTAGSGVTVKLQMDSKPAGADILVDGSFVGSTPSDLQVPEGDHTVVVRKSGFRDWERKLKVNAGSNVHLQAELER